MEIYSTLKIIPLKFYDEEFFFKNLVAYLFNALRIENPFFLKIFDFHFEYFCESNALNENSIYYFLALCVF